MAKTGEYTVPKIDLKDAYEELGNNLKTMKHVYLQDKFIYNKLLQFVHKFYHFRSIGVSSRPIVAIVFGKLVKFLEFGLRLWKFMDILRLPFVRRWVDECDFESGAGSSPINQLCVFLCVESYANRACYSVFVHIFGKSILFLVFCVKKHGLMTMIILWICIVLEIR